MIRSSVGICAHCACLCVSLAAFCQSAAAGQIVTVSDASGLSAEVEFTLLDPMTLVVRAKNTSTGVPSGFSSADQLLTSVSWDFSPAGLSAGTSITGGSVIIGPMSSSMSFSTGSYGAGYDVSGEYGYGNSGGTGILPNFVSGNTAGATPFGGANLDGPVNLNGPQAGLVANPALVSLGGLGAIQNEIIATLTLSNPIADLNFLDQGVTVEFGSDAAFLTTHTIPEPSSVVLGLTALASLTVCKRRKKA